MVQKQFTVCASRHVMFVVFETHVLVVGEKNWRCSRSRCRVWVTEGKRGRVSDFWQQTHRWFFQTVFLLALAANYSRIMTTKELSEYKQAIALDGPMDAHPGVWQWYLLKYWCFFQHIFLHVVSCVVLWFVVNSCSFCPKRSVKSAF